MTKPLEIVTGEVARRGQVPTENEIRNAIAEYLVYNHWLVLRVNSGAAVTVENGKRRFVSFVKWSVLGENPQTAGVSDLLALHPDPAYKPLAIECKRPGNTTTEAQERFMAAWTEHGGIAVVAQSIDDVKKALNQ